MDNLKVSKKYNLGIGDEVDEFGNVLAAVAFDSPPVWSLTDPTLGVIVADPDGLHAVLSPTGLLGACQLQAVAQVGGKPFMGVDDLTFLSGDMVSFKLSVAEGVDN